MQEEADPLFAAQPAQERSERDQMVVVNPDDVVGPQERCKLGGKRLVDPPIAVEIGGPEIHEIEAIVEKRPKHAVCVTQIVIGEVLRR